MADADKLTNTPLEDRVTYRPATEEDATFAESTHSRGFRDVVVRQFGSWDKEKQRHYFDLSWAPAKFTTIELDGMPCGIARVVESDVEIRVDQIIIAPEFQGQGIGTLFTRQLQEKAQKQGTLLTLRVLHMNEAVRLYERLGFVAVSRGRTHTEMEWRPART